MQNAKSFTFTQASALGKYTIPPKTYRVDPCVLYCMAINAVPSLTFMYKDPKGLEPENLIYFYSPVSKISIQIPSMRWTHLWT